MPYSLCGLTELAELPVMFNEDTVLLFEHFKVPKHYQNALMAFWGTQESSSIGQLRAWNDLLDLHIVQTDTSPAYAETLELAQV